MNLSQRLRTCAKHTGLDAVIELLNEAADEIERLSGGKSVMLNGLTESETDATASVVGIAATQPAEVTDEQIAACVKRASTYGLPFVGLLNPGGTPSDFSKRFTVEILALRPERVPMTDERSVSVKVDRELFRFHSEQDWVNKARSRYANCVVQKGHYITVDAAGHVMHMGLCFKHAVYPVTVYQLQTNWPKEKA